MLPIGSIDTQLSASVQISEQSGTEKSKFGGRTRKMKKKRKWNEDAKFCHLSLRNVKWKVLSIECAVEEVQNLLLRKECYVIQS
ncbi:hypothetical protein F2Q69_00030953 [Brassica cretica]|uniref:Uncharacterized protein n=1 Tax=Brassica cretica TaxID=69181 RepID=A0A8S9RQV3_BRACR|nr:hypothetical protein F2Q69_00030953 [Brassica cretica]